VLSWLPFILPDLKHTFDSTWSITKRLHEQVLSPFGSSFVPVSSGHVHIQRIYVRSTVDRRGDLLPLTEYSSFVTRVQQVSYLYTVGIQMAS
jgi:hypothetical protein